MSVQIYACLCGEWVNLNDDPNCKMGIHHASPFTWREEGAEVFSPITKEKADTLYQQDYVNIHYKNSDYRIHPMFIQIKTTS